MTIETLDIAATHRKRASGFEWKAEGEGLFRAVIATFNVVDKDGEVTRPGAFPNGKEIPISAYGHTSWDGALPVGMATIGSDQKIAWVDGRFFLDTAAGLDTYKVQKALGPMGEWSYGFRATKVSTDEAELAQFPGAWRILEQVDVFEASPVLLGAGVGTGTLWVKSASLPLADHFERVLAEVNGWKTRVSELASLRAKEGRVLSAANRERLATVRDALKDAQGPMAEAVKGIDALLEETEPSRDDGKALQQLLLDAHLEIIERGLRVA